MLRLILFVILAIVLLKIAFAFLGTLLSLGASLLVLVIVVLGTIRLLEIIKSRLGRRTPPPDLKL